MTNASRGDHWRPPPRRRVRGAGPADPRRSPAVPLRRKRSMRRVRMCSQSPAGRSRGSRGWSPRRRSSRFDRAPLPAASRAGATPSRARPRRTRGASFPKALSALSRGARERRTRSRNHGPGTGARKRLKRPTSCPSSRGSRRCPRSRGSPGESFCLRAASASRRRARRSHLAGSSLVAPSRLCRTGSPPNERKPPEARLRRRAYAHFRRGGRRPVRARAAAPGPTPRRICAQIMPPRLRLRHCGRVLGGDARPVRDPGAPVRRHTRRRIRAARFALRIFLRKCQ